MKYPMDREVGEADRRGLEIRVTEVTYLGRFLRLSVCLRLGIWYDSVTRPIRVLREA